MKETIDISTNKELEQQKIVLLELNKQLSARLEELQRTVDLQHQKESHKTKELEQQKILLHEISSLLNDEGRSLDDLFTILAHELKTPLVPIETYSDMFLKGLLGNLTDKQKERMKMVKTSASALNDIITNVIDSKKLESGKIKLNLRKNDIYKIVSLAIQKMDKQASAKGAWFYCSPLVVSVSCDEKRITQVLVNLIKNSINAVPDKTGEIKIAASDKGDHIEVKVADNGTGISPDKIENIFSKFSKNDMSETREDPGIGLGLYLCKQIVEKHGGKIWIESQEKRGTTVYFTLPKK